MSKPKRTTIIFQAVLLACVLALPSHAQNTANPYPTLKAPVVKLGTGGDAAVASNGDRLAIHITGRNDSNLLPQQYAKLLANAFANRKYTDKPIYITVTYQKWNEAGNTLATIYMDGGRYKTKDGYNVFTPEQIASGIQSLIDVYIARHGSKHIVKEGESIVSLEGGH